VKNVLVWCLVLIGVTGIVACVVAHANDSKPVIDLTKEESLLLMDTRFRLVSAQADWDDALKGLATKYGIDITKYRIELAKGKLIEVKTDAPK
jgi:hypothetical protein